MKPWMVISEAEDDPDDEVTHIIPMGDTREHDIACDCWCQPYEDEEEPNVLIHRSADGRELEEYYSGSIH